MKAKNAGHHDRVSHNEIISVWVVHIIDRQGQWSFIDFPTRKKALGAIHYFNRHYKGKQYRDKYDDYYRGVL